MNVSLLPASLLQPAIGDGSFVAGTPIAVPSPDGAPTARAVETLARGDMVLTLSGSVAVRHVTVTRRAPADELPRQRLLPVHIAAGAFGEGQPTTDLLLPPEQLVHVMAPGLRGGALVPLGALVNGTTIRRAPQDGPLDWVRLELERPGVVIAAGLLAAARLDPADAPPAPLLPANLAMLALRRHMAQGGTQGAETSRPGAPGTPPSPPDAEAPPARPDLPPEPMAASPSDIAPVAAPPAPPEPAQAEPAQEGPRPVLRIVVQGAALAPLAESSGSTLHVMLPPETEELRLVSPRGLPAGISPADRPFERRFGVAVRSILLDGAPLALDGPSIGSGFHGLEVAGGDSWRWTDGEAVLHLPPSPAPRRLSVAITDWHALLQPE